MISHQHSQHRSFGCKTVGESRHVLLLCICNASLAIPNSLENYDKITEAKAQSLLLRSSCNWQFKLMLQHSVLIPDSFETALLRNAMK